MPRTKAMPAKGNNIPNEETTMIPSELEVLTLTEAAQYLRVAPEDVVRSAEEQGLPARKIGQSWRFLKGALRDWLRAPSAQSGKEQFWQTHFGALKDDPYREEMLQTIYRQRKQPG